jgi:hypothetical protein
MLKFVSMVLLLSVVGVQAEASCLVEIRGTVQRPVFAHQAMGAHVHVQLLDAAVRVVASRTVALPPTAPRKDAGAGRRVAYQAHFTPDEAARAVHSRTLLHAQAHRPSCDSSL